MWVPLQMSDNQPYLLLRFVLLDEGWRSEGDRLQPQVSQQQPFKVVFQSWTQGPSLPPPQPQCGEAGNLRSGLACLNWGVPQEWEKISRNKSVSEISTMGFIHEICNSNITQWFLHSCCQLADLGSVLLHACPQSLSDWLINVLHLCLPRLHLCWVVAVPGLTFINCSFGSHASGQHWAGWLRWTETTPWTLSSCFFFFF